MTESQDKDFNPEQTILPGFSEREWVFANAYIVCLNKKNAAIQAGAPEGTAKNAGYEMYNRPHVKAYIGEQMKAATISAEETVKAMSDIAHSQLNDFFTVKQVMHTPRIEVSLQQVIDQEKADLDFEIEFEKVAKYDADEMTRYLKDKARRERNILRLELELKKNPGATRVIDGKTEWIEVAELDMVKLTKEKEKGRIKSIRPGQYGYSVELYSAADMLLNMGKHHGVFAKDNEQLKPDFIPPMNDDQVDKVLDALNKKVVNKK